MGVPAPGPAGDVLVMRIVKEQFWGGGHSFSRTIEIESRPVLQFWAG